jgi:uncharacterized protein (TIGR00375 family)
MVVPAHAWTPWFSVFGSQSGFCALEECFGEYAKHIYAIETGLSSDPPMNWRWSHLDRLTLLSNSDAHSLEKLGREANVFEFDAPPTYAQICEAIKTANPTSHKASQGKRNFSYTIEFFPEEGKYHLDGHRTCGVVWEPAETKKNNYLCAKCKRQVTVGVVHRVDNLADKKNSDSKNKIPYKSIVPLAEIIGECFDVGVKSKKVTRVYDEMINKIGNEFFILLDVDLGVVKKEFGEIIAEAISRVRENNIFIKPGYDGEYGIVKIFNPEERKKWSQKSLI